MDDKINKSILFYQEEKERLIKSFEERGNFSVERIIHVGKELEIILIKISALEIAKHN